MDNTSPINRGQQITLKPEWQDQGDTLWTITVLEDLGDRVYVEWTKEECDIKQRETIKKFMVASAK